MSQSATPRGARPTAKAATEPVTGAWADPFLHMLDESTAEAGHGPRVVSVPDSNTAYALQQLCVSPDLPADGCLTARYVVSGANGLGTMLAGLVRDVGTLRDRERETLGALVDDNQGARWADFASRLTSSVGWPAVVASTGPHGASGGYLSAEAVRRILGTLGELLAGERLVLFLDSDRGAFELEEVATVLPPRVFLVLTIPPELEGDWLAEAGPLLRLPRYQGRPPSQDRIRYESALAADRPADEDALGMTGLALTTAKLLMHEGTGPICIGIEAPWGKGKSSFLRLVCGQAQRQTEANPTAYELLPVDFNAWVYSNAEQAWAGLAVEVVAAAEARLGRWGATRLRWSYAWEHRRRPLLGALGAAVLAIGLSVLVAWLADWDVASESAGNPLADVLATFSPALVGVILLLGASYRLTRPVSQRVQEYLARPDHASRRGYQNDVVSDLRFTLATLHRRHANVRVVVLVDDLDRCAEDKVVEILQAINVVLAQSEVYTLLAIDGDMVRRAVFRHYRDSAEEGLPRRFQLDEHFPDEYLEKIVQFSIRLPPTGAATRASYVRSLFTLPAPRLSEIQVVPYAVRASTGERAGLTFDLTHVEPASVGDFTDLPTSDTPAEADAMAVYQALLDDNPREIKRAINVHRFVKIALYRSESPPSENLQRRLVLWVILCLTAPDAVSRLLHRSDLDAHHENLLEVAGLRLSERIGEVPDLLPLTDLPLLVAAANLIQLVGAPGRPDGLQPDVE